MNFIELRNGNFVPVHQIGSIQRGEDDNWWAFRPDGSRLGVLAENPENLGRTFVPAASGLFATVIEWLHDDGVPVANRMPIAAWRVTPGDTTADAVVPEVVTADAMVLIECPDGTLLEPFCQTFDNVEAALMEMKKRQARRVAAKK